MHDVSTYDAIWKYTFLLPLHRSLSLFLYIYIYTPKYVEIYSHLCIYQLDKVFNKET